MSATDDLMALLKRHYIKPGLPLPGGVFVPEVGQNGGWGSGSRCDAIYQIEHLQRSIDTLRDALSGVEEVAAAVEAPAPKPAAAPAVPAATAQPDLFSEVSHA